MMRRYKVHVNGIVQGVGFRPFIHNLAVSLGLQGYICNTSCGVDIEIQGGEENVQVFLDRLTLHPPPLSQIIDLSWNEIKLQPSEDFLIHESKIPETNLTHVSPDISVCSECVSELFDPLDRRFRYPFINCTNCGPRYTILFDIPYDRHFTSMSKFKLCPDCEKEYCDPNDRRFHAQPNACEKCGPRVTLLDNSGNQINSDDPIKRCSELLLHGAIIAVKGLGGFHLMCDADNNDAVLLMRKRKHREAKPFAVMSANLLNIDSYASYSDKEAELLISPKRPIVLLRKKLTRSLAEAVVFENKYYGVMLAYTPLQYLLLDCPIRAVVATSGNIAEEPIAISNDEAFERLGNIADYMLIHNRDILVRADDSVARIVDNKIMILRRSRGYVPTPLLVTGEFPEVLGCGGELKNTFCYLRGNNAFLSQHIGDLENDESCQFYQDTVRHMSNLFDIRPSIIAHDMHPDYFTTKFARHSNIALSEPVQHHHAHMVSCMAENNYKDTAIGIVLDGAGYGNDGRVWGGEILVGDWLDFQRFAHLEYLPLPGGEKAMKEPWRMGICYLYKTFGKKINDLPLPVLKAIDIHTRNLLLHIIDKEINSPLTSSCGRLFDGAASILGIQMENRFEGQAAMELEHLVSDSPIIESYTVNFPPTGIPVLIPYQMIIRGIVEDYLNELSTSIISAKFHNTIAYIFFEMARRIKQLTGISTVILSGGCFQNAYLLQKVRRLCEDAGMKTLIHSRVPPNDGGISLGQAVIAGTRSKYGKNNKIFEGAYVSCHTNEGH